MKTEIISKEKKDNIFKILKEKGALDSCMRCYHTTFYIVDGYFVESIYEPYQIKGDFCEYKPIGLNQLFIACICDKCGFVMKHAREAFDLSSTNDNQE